MRSGTPAVTDGVDEPSLYEALLAAAGEGVLPAPPPPRTSAAVVPWRRTPAGEVEVYWLRRSRSLPFLGGWYAFPGGGLDAADAALPIHGEPAGVASGQRTPNETGVDPETLAPDLPPGLAACALRELWEETGLLLAADEGGRPVPRAALPARGGSIAALLAGAGLALDASRLRFAGRWLTPPLGARRFDNRFFLCAWRPEDGEPAPLPPESEAGEWVLPATAIARWERAESLVAPPVLHLLRVLAAHGPEATASQLLDLSAWELGPLRRIELLPGAITIPLRTATLPPATHTHAYLLGFGEAVLVDPGSGDEEEIGRLLGLLAAARERLGRRVTEIWLTHHHPDHMAGADAVRAALGVPLRAHPRTAARLAARGIEVDGELADGERRRLAGEPPLELEVLHTPGHAAGHLAFRLLPSGAIVCGDLVSGLGTVVIDPPDGEMEAFLASLDRLARLAPPVLLPAHGAPLADGTAALAALRAHRLAREEAVLAAWKRGLREPAAIVPVVYPGLSAALELLAARQVRAHLDRLDRHGRLTAANG